MATESATFTASSHWPLRDLVTAAILLMATAAFVLWQNAHLAVLWDVSYILENSVRFAAGQVPYRDFPFVYPPITFAVQAGIMRLTGHVYFHHVLYAAITGGLATVLTWRIVLRIMDRATESAWTISVLLTAPLSVLGIYSIFPHPFYDCDCTLAILVAVSMLQRLEPLMSSAVLTRRSTLRCFITGIVLVVPLFIKQNIGLPFLLIVAFAVASLFIAGTLAKKKGSLAAQTDKAMLCVLAGTVTALLTGVMLIQLTYGLTNYLHWTIHFAAERRLPGLGDMLGVYAEPSLTWTLPCMGIAFVIAISSLRTKRWAQGLCLVLFAVPFVRTDILLALTSDSDDRAANLLSLWPLLLIASIALTVYALRKGPTIKTLLPLIVLATIHGTLLSQQLWGSTYAIWPLLVLLVAQMFAFLATGQSADKTTFLLPLSAVLCVTLVLSGGLYAASAERLSYAHLDNGPLVHATLPALEGMSIRGSYIPELEQLIRFADAEIPVNDGILLLPGEDPFYFATGRVPQFPLLMFDSTTDPYTPDQVVALARTHSIQWLILKKHLQLTEDPTPQAQVTLQLLLKEFVPYRSLDGYEIYRRR